MEHISSGQHPRLGPGIIQPSGAGPPDGLGLRRGQRRMRASWVGIAVALVLVTGCARPPDWIEQTLVTVDVTGVWRGTFVNSYLTLPAVLTLQQNGPRVTGQIKMNFYSAGGSVDGPLEGTVSGDIFRFRDSRGRVIGEVQVKGDEMSGPGTFMTSGSSGRFDFGRQP